jgi:hypothetical protein
LPIECLVPREHGRDGEVPLNPLPPRISQPPGQVVVRHQTHDGIGNFIGPAGVDEPSVLIVIYKLGDRW